MENLKCVIKEIYTDKALFKSMSAVAKERGISTFSYRRIANRAIEEDE